MMKRILPALKWFLIALPAIWGATALWLWHKVADCSSPMSSYCLNVYEDGIVRFFSLSWVWEYQTLVAGVLAFVAGTFAYHSAIIKIRHQEVSERRAKRVELRTACLILVDALREKDEILDAILRSQPQDKKTCANSDTLASSSESMALLYQISPILAWVTARSARYLNDKIERLKNQTVTPELICEVDGLILLCSAAKFLLSSIADNVPEVGEYDFETAGNKVPAGCLKEMLEKCGDIPKPFNAYYDLFDWS